MAAMMVTRKKNPYFILILLYSTKIRKPKPKRKMCRYGSTGTRTGGGGW
jgi:hypothetical protein